MQSVGAFEAKTHLSRLLDDVPKGETVEITKRGKPVARLVPVEDSDAARFEAFRRLGAMVERIRGRMTAEEILAARGEGPK